MGATPTPINMAEAIIEPFWDPHLSGLDQWRVQSGNAHGLKVEQSWCHVKFEWASRPKKGPALHMMRVFDVDCSGYDKLLLSVMAPKGSVVRLTAATNAGALTAEAPPTGDEKVELALDLNGDVVLKSLIIEIDAAQDGIATGWFNWIGLQNTALLDRYLDQWGRFDDAWADHLQGVDYEPEFKPRYGILISESELDSLRERHDQTIVEPDESPFAKSARRAQSVVPEDLIQEFACYWGDTRFNRVRDHGKVMFGYGPSAAIAGLLFQDKDLLRLAARYAMSIGMCDHWDDSFISRFPGGIFEHRSFVQSQAARDVALVLDLAGEMFTRTGRDFLMRRLAEEAIGNINFNTWKFEYIFHNNQLAWFTPGRMAAYLVLEQEWPRVKPYTDLAYRDLIESLDYAILPDGGFVEGPTYFNTVGRNACVSLYYYARARGMDFFEVIPDRLRKTGDFAAAVASTTPEMDVIPICDSGKRMDDETLALMAALLPESAWTSLFHKSIARNGGVPRSVLGWQMWEQIPKAGPRAPAFVQLPEMGVLASTRLLGDLPVKILLMGNKAGAGHTHEDKGSFVLEFAGETFAMDPGTCSYSNPLSGLMKQCQRHNMLVPYGMQARPHPQNPLKTDVRHESIGDTQQFRATVELAKGWEGYYRTWRRTWMSPNPSLLTIRDEYVLDKGKGVEFYWQTELPVEIRKREVVITGKRGRAIFEVPDGCKVRVDELPLVDGVQNRIVLQQNKRSGQIEITVRLEAK